MSRTVVPAALRWFAPEPRRGWLLFLPFIVGLLAAKVVIVGKALSAAEIAGAASALAACRLRLSP